MEVILTFIQRAIMQGIPILFGASGEILTEKSGNLNLGIPGIMYMGGVSGLIAGFLYEKAAGENANGFLGVLISDHLRRRLRKLLRRLSVPAGRRRRPDLRQGDCGGLPHHGPRPFEYSGHREDPVFLWIPDLSGDHYRPVPELLPAAHPEGPEPSRSG